jgi:phosphatidylglycerol---prolipoprotein diacylglyceryl transferase
MLFALKLRLLPLTLITMPGIVRVGHIRVSVFGFIAAVGLIAAIWLSQYTARPAGVAPQKLWDAGIFIVLAAFVLSRILLIAQDPSAFLRYPLLVISLPSLTYTGIALTAIATLLYLRLVKLPLLATLDAWTPPAALLSAVLCLAHFIEGTDAGLPTTLPWGVLTPGDTILGRVHPVQIYLLLAATLIGLDAYRLLKRPHSTGLVAARALLVGGIAFYLLDMLAQPADTNGAALLDPGQYIALGGVAIGCSLLITLLPTHTRAASLSNTIAQPTTKEHA